MFLDKLKMKFPGIDVEKIVARIFKKKADQADWEIFSSMCGLGLNDWKIRRLPKLAEGPSGTNDRTH